MFSSLASFLFGSNTNSETNSAGTTKATATGLEEKRDTKSNLVDTDNIIEVTSSRIPIAGAQGEEAQGAIKRGKNKRNKARQQNKCNVNLKQAKVVTPNSSFDEEDFDESDWFIVEKEEEILPILSDSEEENAPIRVADWVKRVDIDDDILTKSQLEFIYQTSHRNTARNFYEETHYNNPKLCQYHGLSLSSCTVTDCCRGSKHEASADGGVTKSLCSASPNLQEDAEKATNDFDALNSMEESWFVTPPPCFTSTGPINMETSPYENLLIEHPSMSVYYNIRMARENFVKLDIEGNDLNERPKKGKKFTNPKKKSQAAPPRDTGLVCRLDRQSVTQMKQEFLARNVQKLQIKQEQQDKGRSALKRTNKVRDVQSRNHIQRRSDRQYSKICSNFSNNRKTNCY